MMQYENKLSHHNNLTGNNIDLDEYINDVVEENEIDYEIDRDNLDMSEYTGDDGNYDEDDNQNDIDFDS